MSPCFIKKIFRTYIFLQCTMFPTKQIYPNLFIFGHITHNNNFVVTSFLSKGSELHFLMCSISVVVLENELMYGIPFEVSDAVLKDDFLVPIGKAKIEKVGKDVTIVSHSKAVGTAIQAAQELLSIGVDAEVKHSLEHVN